ncbi:IMV membrane protein A21, partial [Monkeypox virus]
DR